MHTVGTNQLEIEGTYTCQPGTGRNKSTVIGVDKVTLADGDAAVTGTPSQYGPCDGREHTWSHRAISGANWTWPAGSEVTVTGHQLAPIPGTSNKRVTANFSGTRVITR
ncbi:MULTISPECIES: hypothetical protein [unclassified Streptomyces]|uniref:hypothetical protein n=1 Tax=unclassified Streptomyces TaxID=2593676 RepID=UPI0033BFAC46